MKILWTEQDDRRLIELVAEGLREREIGARLGKSVNAVHARIQRLIVKGAMSGRIRAQRKEAESIRRETHHLLPSPVARVADPGQLPPPANGAVWRQVDGKTWKLVRFK